MKLIRFKHDPILHRPVDRCTDIDTFRSGFLCNCGRTILGDWRVEEHFGKSPAEVEKDLQSHKEMTEAIKKV